MKRIKSFAPLLGENPRVLVLGSMPSALSLSAHAYYANPRNAFWRVMAKLFCFSADLPYQARCQHLLENQVAVWDVYRSCERVGSLDSAIQKPELNDIANLLQRFSFRAVWLNGGEAALAFRRAYKNLPLEVIALPSTSPANARMNFDEKYSHWRAAWEKVYSAA